MTCERVAYDRQSWFCLTHNQLEEREGESVKLTRRGKRVRAIVLISLAKPYQLVTPCPQA